MGQGKQLANAGQSAGQVGGQLAKKAADVSNTDKKDALADKTKPWDEAKAQAFLNKAGQANTVIDASYANAEARTKEVSIAYGDAYKLHTDALNAASSRQALIASLLVGAALSFVSGPAGPFISGLMGKLVTSKPILDGIEEMAKWGITQAGTALAPPGTPALKAFPTDPLKWQNQTESRLLGEKSGMYSVLAWWQGRVNAKDTSFNLDMDPVKAFQAALKTGGTPLANVGAVDIEAQARTFEKGFWKAWVEQFGYKLTVGFGGYWYAGENVPKEAGERLVALLGSEDAAKAFVVQHGAKVREKADKEASELNSMPRMGGMY
jgi:hypothetical protein